ncbi:MAG TPA: ABC transporter permease [Candidatus Corynebacterium gallistercoris]|uniref:Transport permease protein n=1 Tax=Candidatus Corynebacterium gallistercoris TaxID=2838530 RepID=A0A9D1RY92_9CORY|nr:ABC transporter permease [Candidatus Corynebacterium gallistercoris]
MSNWLSDVRAVTIRNFIRFRSTPDVFVFAILQPIMFVLMFSQVFGGAINVPGVDYTNFLMAGIFAQTAIFGATFSGMFMTQDRKDGLIDRFKTLPMHNSAVLVARTISDLAINGVSLAVMILTGLVVGWRPEAGFLSFLGGAALLLAFSWSFSWVLVWLGMQIKSVEAFNSATFMVMFPLTFLSNAFVPTETMPKVLQVFAEWNPVSALVHATRTLFGNNGDMPEPTSWPMQHSLAMSLVGIIAFAVIFAPLSAQRFRKI